MTRKYKAPAASNARTVTSCTPKGLPVAAVTAAWMTGEDWITGSAWAGSAAGVLVGATDAGSAEARSDGVADGVGVATSTAGTGSAGGTAGTSGAGTWAAGAAGTTTGAAGAGLTGGTTGAGFAGAAA